MDITICNKTWKFYTCDRIEQDIDNKFTLGICDNKNRTIAISVKDTNNTPLSQEDINITIIHELIHAILFDGGYEHSDEELIEILSTNLYNTINQLWYIENNYIKTNKV